MNKAAFIGLINNKKSIQFLFFLLFTLSSSLSLAKSPNGCDSLLIFVKDSNPTVQPSPLVGFGSSTTGGRGGKFVKVTSLSNNSATVGSIRWALNQYIGEPVYIALCVEGEIALSGSALKIIRKNVTIDGRFAPGSGCWFTGDRIEIRNDNIFLDHIVHYGNDPTPDGNSDCLSWGDWGGSEDCNLGYVRNCEFLHGADEVFAFTSRKNGESTGPTVTNVTLENTIIANPINILSHPYLYFIGDGASNVTNYNVLIASGSARYPFQREFVDNIEFINCAMYNFNENTSNIDKESGADFISCLYRLGPRWNNIRAPFAIYNPNKTYLEDILVDSKIGKVNSHGLTRGGTAQTSSKIAHSGLIASPSNKVEYQIMKSAGDKLYSGAKDTATTLAVLNNFYNGDSPDNIVQTYGPVRSAIGATYPPSNEKSVPNEYLAIYPSDTDPSYTISDGSAWNGYMVAERIGAWLVWGGSSKLSINSIDSDGSISIDVMGGKPPYSFHWSNGATTQNIKNLPIGTYTVTVTDQNGCSGQKSINITSISGINNTQASSSINVYPNPASSILYIDDLATNQNFDGRVQIFELSGRKVKFVKVNDKNFDLDISDLDKGLYLVKLGGVNEQFKFIKE